MPFGVAAANGHELEDRCRRPRPRSRCLHRREGFPRVRSSRGGRRGEPGGGAAGRIASTRRPRGLLVAFRGHVPWGIQRPGQHCRRAARARGRRDRRGTAACSIRKLGGWKSPLLVRAGHRVNLRIPEGARTFAGLGYGPLPQGFIEVRDTHHTITFVPCPPDEPAYGGAQPTVGPVTFWSGGIIVNRAPACVPLEIYVDDEPEPRRLVVSLAAGRCEPAGE